MLHYIFYGLELQCEITLFEVSMEFCGIHIISISIRIIIISISIGDYGMFLKRLQIKIKYKINMYVHKK